MSQTASQPFHPDREALAHFIETHRSQIKTRFRERFAAGAMRFYDSSDFLATVFRRADSFTTRLDTVTARDIRRLLREIMLEALSDCARTELQDRRLRQGLRRADPDRSGAREPDDRVDLPRLGLSNDEMELARLHAGGLQHSKVATILGLSAPAVRMRWHRLLEKLRASRGLDE
ncbi:MAG: hypothetical protein IPJ41_04310 [Phycisphaerales bacterium]|nr:hypothetical protein [Phycisphaerales bacterium]